MERRFGKPEALDAVLRNAKEQGFKIRDFYIAPKTDWTHGLYEPLKNATIICDYETLGDVNASGGEPDISDVASLYTYLTSSNIVGRHSEEAGYRQAADVNQDGNVDVYDLQRLYEAVSSIRPF